MKTNQGKQPIKFGDFIIAAYDALGKRRAKQLVALVVNAHLLEFQGPQRYEFSG